jgi:hypothetical protein
MTHPPAVLGAIVVVSAVLAVPVLVVFSESRGRWERR